MAAREFVTPDFLADNDQDIIHDRMMSNLPDDLDKTEGGYPFDLVKPHAMEIARAKGYEMPMAIRQIWPEFASDDCLDYHGITRSIVRKSAVPASGELTVTGASGTYIAKGDLFSTESINGAPNMMYEAIQEYNIPPEGTIKIMVQCTVPGVVGNTAKNTVVLKATRNDGIETVTNEKPLTGGVEIETDDEYRERQMEYDRTHDVSFCGTPTDYIRWAKEVPGVGEAICIEATDDSGYVTLVITDSNGEAAGTQLCQSVYDYIFKPDDPINRIAPINALLKVVPPVILEVTIKATIETTSDNIETITEKFLENMKSYLVTAPTDKEIRYTQVCKVLAATDGVYDYKDVLLNGSTENVSIAANASPSITKESITLTPGTV